MIVKVGTNNAVKLQAVKEVIREYYQLKNASVKGVVVNSNVNPQPKTLEEIIRGARNRAQQAFADCFLSLGIESGLFAVPYVKTGYLETTACVVYDGDFYYGLSSAFECPGKVISLVVDKGLDLNEAFYRAGLTSSLDIGQKEGAVGLLTKGRITRKEYTKQAIYLALIHWERRRY